MKSHLWSLGNIFEESSLNPKIVLIIANTSIKNNVTASIFYILSSQSILKKTIYHVINVTSTEAEMFLIRCGINQAVDFSNIKRIIVITNIMHTIRHIFDLSTHTYQLQSIAISLDLRIFFNKNTNNSIIFWNYPSSILMGL